MEDLFYYQKLKAAFEEKRNLEKGKWMKAYMKNHFEFYGTDSPTRKQIVSEILKTHGKPDTAVLMGLTGLLWADEHREMQYVAMQINAKMLPKQDAVYAHFLDKLIGQKSWWDTVDWLAPGGMGTLFKMYPGMQDSFIEEWMASGNKWYIRSAILFQLHYKKETDFDLVKSLILQTVGSKEFFINKASGWILREYSKTNQEAVINFINKHPELHSLTKREGLKWMKNKGIV